MINHHSLFLRIMVPSDLNLLIIHPLKDKCIMSGNLFNHHVINDMLPAKS